jgi:hypothetical protein
MSHARTCSTVAGRDNPDVERISCGGGKAAYPRLIFTKDDLIEKFHQFRWIASSITQGRPVAAAQIDTAMLGWPTSPAISLWPAARWTRRSSR